MSHHNFIIDSEDPILVTGAAGFIGSRLVKRLLDYGFRNIRCFVRPSSNTNRLRTAIAASGAENTAQIISGNLLSKQDCAQAVNDIGVIFHLAAGGSAKSFPDAFMNSVVTTRNLLEATIQRKCLKRFVNISSLAVYSNQGGSRCRSLDETSPIEVDPARRGDAYCYAKAKQDEIVEEYARNFSIPHVTLRPGVVYGPGTGGITARVGIGTFGIFLHLGGFNKLPLTYIDNCADAMVLAGLTKDVDGEVFNITDDDLPSSREFLRLYKRNVTHFRSIYIPHLFSYFLSYIWERYSDWSEGQLPPVFNCRRWYAYWKKATYSNAKLKSRVNWQPKLPTAEGLQEYFRYCREKVRHA